jgi:hypothetical protein
MVINHVGIHGNAHFGLVVEDECDCLLAALLFALSPSSSLLITDADASDSADCDRDFELYSRRFSRRCIIVLPNDAVMEGT